MPASFIPLSPRAPGSAHRASASAPGVVSLPQRPFQVLGEGTAPASSPTQSGVTSTPAAATGVCSLPPSLTVQREQGQISRIRVQCACGEVIELECVY